MDLSWTFPYPSRRMPVFSQNAVATSQPLAAQAGLTMLQKGGNAVDAAIATAIALTVVEPTSNGLGSDAFALLWDGEKLVGINGSGRSPEGWDLNRFKKFKKMPETGWDTVTVPGAVHLWTELWKRYGSLSFKELFEPAVTYADKGFHISPITAERWMAAKDVYENYPEFQRVFFPDDTDIFPGKKFINKDQANSLIAIAESMGESFYKGALAEKIAESSKKDGGAMRLSDLSAHRSEWVEPISLDFNGVTLNELPPNGQGLAALIALGIIKHLNWNDAPIDSVESIHLQIEAMKLAFYEAHRHIADPTYMRTFPKALMDEDYLASHAKRISRSALKYPISSLPTDHGTVYLTTADQNQMMVSFIQSNYFGFGSGIVVPGTGISLQNRGRGFSLLKDHPNCIGSQKRPFHTIIPGFVTHKRQPLMSFGVMGGHMQPQGHLQMMLRIFANGQNPQAALDAPRWHVTEDFQVALEKGFPSAVSKGLAERGHPIVKNPEEHLFGGDQAIFSLGDGYVSASDLRKDGYAAGF